MSGDFDAKQKPEKIVKRVQKLTRPGSIIIFHDTVKANPELKFILSNILKNEITQSDFFSLREQYFE